MNKDQKFALTVGAIVLAISLVAVFTSYSMLSNKIPATIEEGRVYFNQLFYSTNPNCEEACANECAKMGYDGFGDFNVESAGRCSCACYKTVQ
jgi:hypothetical protein